MRLLYLLLPELRVLMEKSELTQRSLIFCTCICIYIYKGCFILYEQPFI